MFYFHPKSGTVNKRIVPVNICWRKMRRKKEKKTWKSFKGIRRRTFTKDTCDYLPDVFLNIWFIFLKNNVILKNYFRGIPLFCCSWYSWTSRRGGNDTLFAAFFLLLLSTLCFCFRDSFSCFCYSLIFFLKIPR